MDSISSAHDETCVTGLILAGGQGLRMGGVDKGLQLFQGRPLITHVAERMALQVGSLRINCRASSPEYALLPYQQVHDLSAGFHGPLAGIEAGLQACPTPWLATSPCDAPFLPLDLVARLWTAAQVSASVIATAKVGQQLHPVFALIHISALGDLQHFLEEGGRSVQAWYRQQRHCEVAFDDQPAAFVNLNTREDLDRWAPHMYK